MYQSISDLPFKAVNAVDFEYNFDNPGDHPKPLTMALETGSAEGPSTYWKDELEELKSPPFNVGGDGLFLAYFAPAELGCFKALGWSPPHNVIDLYAEFRRITNGLYLPEGAGLIGALKYYGLDHLLPTDKDEMRNLILSGGPRTADEVQSIKEYCAQDTRALIPLFEAMLQSEPWSESTLSHALLRGRYTKAVASMEHRGIPLDKERLQSFLDRWPRITEQLIREIDQAYGVYEGTTFKVDRFEAYLAKNKIPWLYNENGKLRLDRDTFSTMARAHPTLLPLHELRKTLSAMQKTNLQVGADGRNRCMLSPLASKTGRNQPSNSKFIFGLAKWFRRFIKPTAGMSLAYVDWSSQEIAVAAALSGDDLLMEAYNSGDPYISFAIQAGLAPKGATKASHPEIRNQCKQVVLGTNYGMSAYGVAQAAGIHISTAQNLLQRHKETYRVFWKWAEKNMEAGLLGVPLQTCFGWEIRAGIGTESKANTFLNWPMQAHGAEMMRIASILATEDGLGLCAPIHDAFLLEAPNELIEDHVRRLIAHMEQASEYVLGVGRKCRADSKILSYPDRYMEDEGLDMWERVMSALAPLETTYSESEQG